MAGLKEYLDMMRNYSLGCMSDWSVSQVFHRPVLGTRSGEV